MDKRPVIMKQAKKARPPKKTLSERVTRNAVKANSGTSYDRMKVHDGEQYSGMKVGKSHKWYYDKGVWRETKLSPDVWQISYAVTKRRAGKAPEGTGVPIGTGYHWYIVSHQMVHKVNADDYTTEMSGLKFKVAHKRAGKDKWSSTSTAQQRRLIKFFKEMIRQLQGDVIELDFEYEGTHYKGQATPVTAACGEKCEVYEIVLNDEFIGMLRYLKSGSKLEGVLDKKFVRVLSKLVFGT